MTFPMLAYEIGIAGARQLGLAAAVSVLFFPLFIVAIYILTKRMLSTEGRAWRRVSGQARSREPVPATSPATDQPVPHAGSGATELRKLVLVVGLAIFTVWTLFPFLWIVATSIKPDRDLYRKVSLWPATHHRRPLHRGALRDPS